MKITFYEYLVQNNIISASDLMSAFVRQAKENPSLGNLVRNHNLLSSDDLLRVLDQQYSTNQNFEACCKELGLWSEEFSEKLESIIYKDIPSIFKYLITDGKISFSDLTVNLDEYVAMILENPSEFNL